MLRTVFVCVFGVETAFQTCARVAIQVRLFQVGIATAATTVA